MYIEELRNVPIFRPLYRKTGGKYIRRLGDGIFRDRSGTEGSDSRNEERQVLTPDASSVSIRFMLCESE